MSTDNETNFGEEIKKAITEKGMSYAAVAKKMDLPRQSIHRLNLRKTFNLDFLQKLKNATGIDFTNYIFNPKSKRYESYEQLSSVSEGNTPYEKFSNTIEISLSLKINADQSNLTKLSDLITSFKKEAINYGFILK